MTRMLYASVCMERTRYRGWKGFLLWAVVGMLYGFAGLAMLSIGIFVLPIAVIATIAAARAVRVWPEVLGIMQGPAAACLFLAARNYGAARCDETGLLTQYMSATG